MILWKMPVGDDLGTVRDPDGVPLVDVTFSPNATAVAALSTNYAIYVWTVTGVG